jgi:chaperone required for assembly of F1-ATPase
VTGWGRDRRFWRAVSVASAEGGFAVLLDDRRCRTPGGAALTAPTRAAAEAAAAEWAAQGERVDPRSMPFTRALATAVDRVAPAREAVIDEIAGYGASDLLCYRAPHPAALAARQAAAWDPPLAWARARYGAALTVVAGVAPVAQPRASLAALRAAVAARDAFGLTALAELVALGGSLVLGLAVVEGALAPAAAWSASRVDEDWQVEQWGEDAEAADAAARRRAAFEAAAAFAASLAAG